MINSYKILFGGPKGKNLFGISKQRWENNIKIDLRDLEWVGVD
jgi:hypothetical protein